MFAGIVQAAVPIARCESIGRQLSLTLELGEELTRGLAIGASIAVDGVCLTVVAQDERHVRFDVIGETLARTTLGMRRVGERVNVERSLRLGDEVGGHWVSGHVHGIGTISGVEAQHEELTLEVTVPPEWMKFIPSKGFIAVDGCSLTVGATEIEGRFRLHLIPETRRRTTLGARRVGDQVNVELDQTTVSIVQAVERTLAARGIS